ncbi:MAG: cytochrome c oxidase assembly protein [Gaiellaceae bacterium]
MSPGLLAVALAGAVVLYELGRRRLGGGRWRREGGWREEAFYAGLVALALATQPPLDGLADRSFSAHMVQHLLLQMVAPPLLVLGAPWLPVWRMLPSGGRHRLGRWLACSPRAVPLRLLAGTLGRPPVAWLLFAGTVALSHLPAIFDFALRDPLFHETEHALFLGLGLLFWSRALDSPPFHARLRPPQAALYFATAIAAESVLALAILQARLPVYAPYAAEGHRPGGLTALADQQLGGAVMLEPASLPLLIALIWSVKRWLDAAQPSAVAGSSR